MQVSGPRRPTISRERLELMMNVMIHRGPDDFGVHLSDGISMGARRLSIIDVAGGHQPLSNEDGTVWAMQNGELYNHREIRQELERAGHVFRTNCDTEALPHLYEQYGFSVPERLRGKFSLAVWDTVNHRGLIARDRLGVKPLYYAFVGDSVVFGSELKTILASGLIRPELSLDAIAAYLTLGFVPGSLTPFAGIEKLPPGHKLIIENGRARLECYWSLPEQVSVTQKRSVDELGEELIERLEDAVSLRLMSDVPVGAMLSGGIDSSVIVALMAKNTSSPVKTFSVGFAEAGAANELSDARSVARFLGTDHHELELSLSDPGVDLVDLCWQLDEPLADLSALGFLSLSQLAAREVKVALSGQGADELLGGYTRHRNAALAARWDALPTAASRASLFVLRRMGSRTRKAAKILGAQSTVDRILMMKSFVGADLRNELVKPNAASLDPARAAVAAAVSDRPGDFFSSVLAADMRLSLVDDMLHYFDRTSMAHSLEVRVPFLDHHFVEFCATVPQELKVRRLTTKYLLKRASRGLIPDAIIEKRKLGFFYPALGAWFNAESSMVRDLMLDSDARTAQFLDRSAVEALVDRQSIRGDAIEPLLTVVMLELWLRSLDRMVPTHQLSDGGHMIRAAAS